MQNTNEDDGFVVKVSPGIRISKRLPKIDGAYFVVTDDIEKMDDPYWVQLTLVSIRIINKNVWIQMSEYPDPRDIIPKEWHPIVEGKYWFSKRISKIKYYE